jgi:hypothetical protein
MIAKLVPLIVCLIIVLIYAVFVFKLYQTLNTISIKNRKIVPGLVWLVFVPFLGLIWQFIVIVKTASSLKLELKEHHIPIKDNLGFGIGIAYTVLICLSILPILGGLLFLASTVCWIIYWVRIVRYKKQLENGMFLSQIDSIK